MDLRTAWGERRLDPAVGRRWRDVVLANGGQVPPRELLRRFPGRESTTKAFFDELAR